MKDPFDSWLEQQLAEGYSRLGRRPVRPFSAGRLPSLRLALGAALSAKVALAGFAVAALAAGGGVAVAKTVDPGLFGQSVKTAVGTCTQQQTAGQHGIGQCVSNYAVSHNPGASHRSSHAQPGGAAQSGNSQAGRHSPNPPSGQVPGNPGPPATRPNPTPRGVNP